MKKNTDIQSIFNDGRYELINGHIEQGIKCFSEVLRQEPGHKMVQHLTNKNIETFANENNVWRSQQLKLESVMESELER